MTMVAGKWQQPRKQRLHQQRKLRPSGGRDSISGVGGNIGTTMMATTGNKDYNVGRRAEELLLKHEDEGLVLTIVSVENLHIH